MSRFVYRDLGTPIHRLHPVTKLYLSLCGLLLGTTLINIPLLLLSILFCFSAWPIAKMERKYYKMAFNTSLSFLVLFTIMQGLLVPFNETILVPLNLPALIPIVGSAYTTGFGYEGMMQGFAMWLRFFTIFSFVPLLFATTSLLEMMDGLMELRLKFEYAFLVATTVRFLPVFVDIQAQIKDAQRIRGTEYDEGVSATKKLTSVLSLIIPLTVRGFRFASDLDTAIRSRAMCAYKTRTIIDKMPVKRTDWLVMIGMTIFTVVIVAINYLFYTNLFSPWSVSIVLPEFLDIPFKIAAIEFSYAYVNPFLRFAASWIAFPINFVLLVMGLPTLESVNPYYLYDPSFLFVIPTNPIVLVMYGLCVIFLIRSIVRRTGKIRRNRARKIARREAERQSEEAERQGAAKREALLKEKGVSPITV